ncbi:MAG: helix-turn-helix domain-containing protein [Clostridia bacterium]|nr:helix-turn-helix domain-containing protein [Clostridia bacterium]
MIYRIPISPLPEVEKVGHIRYRSGWSESYCHRRNVLIYVVSGEFTYAFSTGESIRLEGGNHLLIPAGLSYKATAGADCDYYYVHFTCTEPLESVEESLVVANLTEDGDAQRQARMSVYSGDSRKEIYVAKTGGHTERNKSLQYRLSRCAEFRQGVSPLDRMRLLNQFFTVLISLAAATGEQLLETKHLSPSLVKLTRYVEENYPATLSLDTLSAHSGLSKQYIMRLFREQLGMTVTQYINEVRLRKSLDLLSFHSLSVSEVAYAVGFSGIYYFDRVFKKAYAITPTEFQKTHRLVQKNHPLKNQASTEEMQ